MDTHRNTSYILAGMSGAITSALLVETFFWVFSLGQTFDDFVWRILTFLPVPMIIGGMAGALLWRIRSSIGVGLSFWFGALGMVFGYFAGVYIYDSLIEQFGWGYRFFGFIVPVLVGILFELFVFGCVWVGVKVYTTTGRPSS